MEKRKCAYRGCKTPISQYNRGNFCNVHEVYEKPKKETRKKTAPKQRKLISIPFEELTEFWWPVSMAGYSIRKTDGEPFLIESPISEKLKGKRIPVNFPPKLYQPYKNKNLFIEFAWIDENNLDEILGFVHEYGLLTIPEDSTEVFVPKRRKSKELVSFFQQEVRNVRKLLLLHIAIQDEDLKHLKQHIEIVKELHTDEEGETIEIVVLFDEKLILSTMPYHFKLLPDGEYLKVGNWQWLMDKLEEEDIVIAAKLCLSQEIARSVAPYIFPTIRLTETGKQEPVYSAHNLLGAIYHQLHMAITKRWHYKECIECGSLYTLTRKDKQFCSKTCETRYHVREHRKRKREGGEK